MRTSKAAIQLKNKQTKTKYDTKDLDIDHRLYRHITDIVFPHDSICFLLHSIQML